MKKRQQFREVVKALELAAPPAVLSRFDTLSHCFETSLAGALVLSNFGFEAKAVPCAILGIRYKPTEVCFSAGMTPRQMYEGAGADAHRPYEEWAKDLGVAVDDSKLIAHVAVEASCGADRALLDLTLGQLRQKAGVDVPLAFTTFTFDKGPRFYTRNEAFELLYRPSPSEQRVQEELDAYDRKLDGFVEDLTTLVEIARYVRLDRVLFYRTLQAHDPQTYDLVADRMWQVGIPNL